MGVLKGITFSMKPIKNIIKPRFNIFKNCSGDALKSLFLKEKNIAEPMMNKKNGKTKSVGVAPCQSACNKGA
mgnify:CR=1 FL=1